MKETENETMKIDCEYRWERGRMIHQCKITATWTMQDAIFGTADPRRLWVYLCTRHFNLFKLGKLPMMDIIPTSKPQRIVKGDVKL